MHTTLSIGFSTMRRQVSRGLAGALLAFVSPWGWCLEVGQSLPHLEPFDKAMLEVMKKYDVPGASLVVAKDGKLLLAKGYGYADRDKQDAMTPQTLFRMGSINKTLTAVMVLKLAEDGKLKLDDPVRPLFEKAGIAPSSPADPRVKDISIRHLLQHSGGFDRERSGDPFFQPRLGAVARRQGVAPVSCDAIIRDSLQDKLDFAPGERFAYSNTGYCMLGRVVEVVTGESYRTFSSREFLMPSTGKGFQAASSTESRQGETKYYAYPGEPLQRGAPGVTNANVPSPYGSYSVENMDALGAWIATPTDVLKFFLAIDGARGKRLLNEESLQTMRSEPMLEKDGNPRSFYAAGIHVVRSDKGDNWWHTGSQPGLQTLALRTRQGYAWVVAFNSRPDPSGRRAFFKDIDQALWGAANAVREWPQGDLFSSP
ncbi:serine hydrolase domain-containing protein [Polaromonas sp. P5_D5]